MKKHTTGHRSDWRLIRSNADGLDNWNGGKSMEGCIVFTVSYYMTAPVLVANGRLVL